MSMQFTRHAEPVQIEKNSLPFAPERVIAPLLEVAVAMETMVREGHVSIQTKPDTSYVTTVDTMAHRFLAHALPLIHDALVISEEGIPLAENRAVASDVWIVDPLDNTRGLVEDGDLSRCSINIVLVRSGEPVLGVTYYHSDRTGLLSVIGAGVRGFSSDGIEELLPSAVASPLRAIAYRGAIAEMAEPTRRLHQLIANEGLTIVMRDLLPLRLRALMVGEGDIYLEPRSLNEWDVAPGIAAMRALGGRAISLLDGKDVVLNSPGLRAPPFLLARPGVDVQDLVAKIIPDIKV